MRHHAVMRSSAVVQWHPEPRYQRRITVHGGRLTRSVQSELLRLLRAPGSHGPACPWHVVLVLGSVHAPMSRLPELQTELFLALAGRLLDLVIAGPLIGAPAMLAAWPSVPARRVMCAGASLTLRRRRADADPAENWRRTRRLLSWLPQDSRRNPEIVCQVLENGATITAADAVRLGLVDEVFVPHSRSPDCMSRFILRCIDEVSGQRRGSRLPDNVREAW